MAQHGRAATDFWIFFDLAVTYLVQYASKICINEANLGVCREAHSGCIAPIGRVANFDLVTGAVWHEG